MTESTMKKMDYVAWAAMFIALAGLFWNVNTGFNRVHERIDRTQAENQRQHDAIEEVLRVFEGRITRLEENKEG